MEVESYIGVTYADTPRKAEFGGFNSNSARGLQTLDPVVFVVDGVEILRLESGGMYYKGSLVEDKGEAHAKFLEWVSFATSGLI